jgi:death on curing protein
VAQTVAICCSALVQPQQSFAGEDLYPSLAEKAAALFFCLNKNHPFVDGNKRFATFAPAYFLDLNNCALDVGEDELVAWAVWVASQPGPSLAMVAEWLVSKIIRV